MHIASGQAADFDAIEHFVEASIRDSFYRPDLTPEQRHENAWIVSIARRTCLAAIDAADCTAFVAREEKEAVLAGFVIVDRRDRAMPEIDWLVVGPSYRGKGVAAALMNQALRWIGPDLPIKLGVIHFNERAIAFYRKFGFADTGEIVGRHEIPRRLMIRPAPYTG